MAARSQSESRQDLDSKFTPVKYESIRQTQGESFTMHQVPNLQPLHDKSRYQHRINPSQYHKPTFAAIDTLLTRLASATASTTSQLCQPFVKSGTILDTTNSDSHIALWLISLGIQKDRILQYLGSDGLHKHKTVDQATKYIRQRFMAARSQSESRQHLDSQTTLLSTRIMLFPVPYLHD